MTAGGQATQRRSRSRGNGEGSVYWFAKRQKWVGAITLDGGRRKVVYADTRQEAAQALVKIQRSVQQDLPVAHKRYTVGTWLDYWLENVIRPEREPTTYELYEIGIRKHIKPVLGRTQLEKLQPEDVSGGCAPWSAAESDCGHGRPVSLDCVPRSIWPCGAGMRPET